MEILNLLGAEFLRSINYFPGEFSLLIVVMLIVLVGLLYYYINK